MNLSPRVRALLSAALFLRMRTSSCRGASSGVVSVPLDTPLHTLRIRCGCPLGTSLVSCSRSGLVFVCFGFVLRGRRAGLRGGLWPAAGVLVGAGALAQATGTESAKRTHSVGSQKGSWSAANLTKILLNASVGELASARFFHAGSGGTKRTRPLVSTLFANLRAVRRGSLDN